MVPQSPVGQNSSVARFHNHNHTQTQHTQQDSSGWVISLDAQMTTWQCKTLTTDTHPRELTIPTSKQMQTHALDRTANGISSVFINTVTNSRKACWQSEHSQLPNQASKQPTPRSTVLLEKILLSQSANKFLTFYRNWRFTTVCSLAHHQTLSIATSTKSMRSLCTFLRPTLLLPYDLLLGLTGGLFPSGFSIKIPYVLIPVLQLLQTSLK